MANAARGNRVALFYLFTALFWGALYAYMSFFTDYAGQVGASGAFAGLIVGSYGFVQMVLRVPVGMLSDRFRRRKPFVILGIAATVTAAGGMLLFPTPVGLLLFRAFAGVAAAAWVTITVLFSSYFKPEDAPAAMGRLNAFNMLGNMSASVIGAQLAQRYGPPAAFWLAIALGAAGLVISFFLRENRPAGGAPPTFAQLFKVGATPALLAVSIIAVLINMVNMGSSGSFLQIYAKGIGASTAQLGYLTIASSLPFIAASALGGGLLIKRMSPKAILTMGTLFITLSMLLIPLTKHFPLLLAVEVLHGTGNGLVIPMLMSLALLAVEPEKRGVAMGFYQSIYALGMFLGPVMTGAISQAFNVTGGFLALCALSALATMLCAALIRNRNPQ